MRRALQSDVFKILTYVVMSILLAALLAPWLYNAGKALAEVTAEKSTNGVIDWLADACRNAQFPRFFNRALLLSSVVLLFPLMSWLRVDRGRLAYRDTPWSLRLPESRVAMNDGQPLRRNPMGLRQLGMGFLLALLVLLALGVLLVKAGFFVWRAPVVVNGATVPPPGFWSALGDSLGPAVVVSVIEEIVFRGVLLGLFLRAMRPWAALISVSLLFSFVHFLQPPTGVMVPDPESATAGLWMVSQILMRFTQPQDLIAGFATLAVVGWVLGYARWRTASLWMPIGLHAGFILGTGIFKALTWASPGGGATVKYLIGPTLREGLVPLVVVLAVGGLVHVYTRSVDGLRSGQ